MPELLFISAAAFETAAIKDRLTLEKKPARFLTCGIGALNAAKSAGTLREQVAGCHVVFVGSCGHFSYFSEPELLRVSRVHWLPVCERHQLAYTIEGIAPPVATSGKELFSTDLPSYECLCAPTISLSAHLPAPFADQRQQYVENVELYSVAAELAATSHTFDIVLATTNQVGANSHEDWRAHHQLAATLTANYIYRRLLEKIWQD